MLHKNTQVDGATVLLLQLRPLHQKRVRYVVQQITANTQSTRKSFPQFALLYSAETLDKHNSAGKDIQHTEERDAERHGNARARTVD